MHDQPGSHQRAKTHSPSSLPALVTLDCIASVDWGDDGGLHIVRVSEDTIRSK